MAKFFEVHRCRVNSPSSSFFQIFMAFMESYFLGLRFWEQFFGSDPIFMFIPLVSLYGFIEETLFRGVVLRSMSPLVGIPGALILTSLLNAGLMLLWGSMMFAIFSFLSGDVFGILYIRTRSLLMVGTLHALQDTWLILTLILLGIDFVMVAPSPTIVCGSIALFNPGLPEQAFRMLSSQVGGIKMTMATCAVR